MTNNLTIVTNAAGDWLSAGRKFNVRVVFSGDRYGRNDCLTHDGDPMVEFYDAAYADDPGFAEWKERGQFVSRYYLTTLLDSTARPVGLDLQGGVDEWKVDADALGEALDFAVACSIAHQGG